MEEKKRLHSGEVARAIVDSSWVIALMVEGFTGKAYDKRIICLIT